MILGEKYDKYQQFIDKHSLDSSLMTPLKKDNLRHILRGFQNIISHHIESISYKLAQIYGGEVIYKILLSVYFDNLDDKWYKFGKLSHKNKVKKVLSILLKKLVPFIKK